MKHQLYNDIMGVSMAGNIDQKVKNRLIRFLLKDKLNTVRSAIQSAEKDVRGEKKNVEDARAKGYSAPTSEAQIKIIEAVLAEYRVLMRRFRATGEVIREIVNEMLNEEWQRTEQPHL